ncbi:hypothetical protein [Cecembia rubra]|uniref:hypothetical protein n=1 Tax=Cecembia rubra TaxID=1485585 RepID=UPI001473BD4E|nr:hypothetical protein [Cecembia rubra]
MERGEIYSFTNGHRPLLRRVDKERQFKEVFLALGDRVFWIVDFLPLTDRIFELNLSLL